MDRSEYARIKIENIPQEFIQEYNFLPMVNNGWIYFEIVRDCYGLPQSGMLANNLLRTRLKKRILQSNNHSGTVEAPVATIQLYLIVDDFGIEYVG